MGCCASAGATPSIVTTATARMIDPTMRILPLFDLFEAIIAARWGGGLCVVMAGDEQRGRLRAKPAIEDEKHTSKDLSPKTEASLFPAPRQRGKARCWRNFHVPQAFAQDRPALPPADLRRALAPARLQHTNTVTNRKFGEDNASISCHEQRPGRRAVHSQYRFHAERACLDVRLLRARAAR